MHSLNAGRAIKALGNPKRCAIGLFAGLSVGLAAGACSFVNEKSPTTPGSENSAAPPAGNPVPANPVPGSPGPSEAPSGTPATFTNVNTYILKPYCMSCHNGSGNSPNLSSYSAFANDQNYVVPGHSTESKIYQVLQDGTMPKGGSKLSQQYIDLMGSWIDAGALSN